MADKGKTNYLEKYHMLLAWHDLKLMTSSTVGRILFVRQISNFLNRFI